MLSVQGPERCTISGFPALQFEIEAVYQMIQIKDLHTTIGGRRAFHQVHRVVDKVAVQPQGPGQGLDGFRETPGPDSEPREHPIRRQSPPSARLSAAARRRQPLATS